MPNIRLLVEMEAPDAGMHQQQPPAAPTIEDKVQEALRCIESGYRSDQEWLMLNKLYRDLMQVRHKSDRIQNLIRMITPALAKYGYHGVHAEERK